jgi:glycerol-3-phosphate dehydrogenase subunit B
MAKKVLIIGGGLAGWTAALTAKNAGAEVILVKGTPGATALASGAWDVLTPESGLFDDPQSVRQALLKSACDPQHIYTSLQSVYPNDAIDTLLNRAFAQLFEHLPRKPEGSLDKVMLLISPLGSLKWTNFADPAQAAGDLSVIRKGRLLIASFPGLASFQASLIKTVLSEAQSSLDEKPFHDIQSAFIEVEGLAQHSLTSFGLAKRLEDPTCFNSFAKALAVRVKQARATHVLLPPVIGIEKNPDLMVQVNRQTHAHCFESLSMVPSLPGLRRQRALESLETKMDHVVAGRVTQCESHSGRIQSIILEEGETSRRIDLDCVILCTGRFIGGGIVKERAMAESLLNLPVFIGEKEVGPSFVGNLVSQQYIDQQALFMAGLKCDRNLRPMNQWNEVAYQNLYAAGSVLGGYEAGASGMASGVAVLSGYLAGLKGAQ